MVEKFRSELESLKKEVLDMGYLARDMLCTAVNALDRKDITKAGWVNANTQKIAEYDSEIEQKCLRLIALYQPMAKDLRIIATVLKMNTYLFRIGRYGKDIADVVAEIIDKPRIAQLVNIPQMAGLTCDMITDSLAAFEKEEISKIKTINERDDIVDGLYNSIFRECVTYMMEDPKTITPCANYIMIARYLERCGDLACKIAEKVNYMVTGERIELK